MFKRKTKQAKERDQAVRETLEQVLACYVSDPDVLEVRASVVVRLRDGQGDDGAPYYVATFGFSEGDRMALYMDHDPTCLVRKAGGVADVDNATEEALSWVGDGALKVTFQHIPGVYQAQFLSLVLNASFDAGSAQFIWALPPSGDMCPCREFPPRTAPTEATPNPSEVSIFVLPLVAVEGLFSSANWN